MSTVYSKRVADTLTRAGETRETITPAAAPAAVFNSNSNSSDDDQDESKEKKTAATVSSTSDLDIPPLGHPLDERRFFWQRQRKNYDGEAVATLPSVYDDPELAKRYRPRDDWENLHRFDPLARWTWNEEYKIIRKIDLRIMIFACVMFMALELDRANLTQVVTDNFLDDMGLDTNDYNLGNTVFKLAFLCAELPSQLVSKWIGPDRWIPSQITLWSIVSASQFWLNGRTSFLACRALLAILQGGFIPDIILYLSYFYKHHELTLRLGYFWTAMSIADVIASFLAAAILNLRGVNGYEGWRWIFLLEGLFTLVIGLIAFGLMPASPTQTKGWLRGKKGWFSDREEVIMVNRVLRDDPNKGDMHNRQAITPKLLWKSMCDYDLWPLYALGLTFQIPATPPAQYLTLILRGIGFDRFRSNLLTIPSAFLHMVTMMGLTYFAEVVGELTLVSMLAQVWLLPFIAYLYVNDVTSINRWVAWGVMTALLSYPSPHPIQVAWNSRNSNTVRSRTVSAALYNMAVQTSGIISSNVYRKDDAPRYKRGNKALLGTVSMNIALYLLTKAYYMWRNHTRDKKWNAMTDEQKQHYLDTTTDEGNKRLDFRFAH